MKERIKIVEVPDDILEDAPFAPEWKNRLRPFCSGLTQRSFFSADGVLHVSPTATYLTKEEALICNRWLSDEKSLLLAKIQNCAGELNGLTRIIVPRVKVVGKIRHELGDFPFCYEDFVSGISLTEAVFQGLGFSEFEQLVEWLAVLHQNFEQDQSLRNYFEERLIAMESIVKTNLAPQDTLDSSLIEGMLHKIEELKDTLDWRVEEEEKVSIIQGDMRDSNILVNGLSLGVVDFEQGVLGGDWFYDLAKLLVLDKEKRPDPGRPYLYRPPLSLTEKKDIVSAYIKERKSRGWTVPNFISRFAASGEFSYIEARHDLYKFENTMSILIYRHLLGWNFYVDKTGPVQRRGVKYLAERLKLNYDW